MADGIESVTGGAMFAAVDMAVSAVIPFVQFVPLIKEVSDVLIRITEYYSTAQHNKRITKMLIERVAAANTAVSILREEDLYSAKDYTSLQRLVDVLQRMKSFSEKITQYNKVQKFLGAKTIESQFNDLCSEYDSSIVVLNLTVTVDTQARAEKERKNIQEDLGDLLKFQQALVESMNSVDQKINNMNEIVEKVSQMTITMQRLDGKNQTTIDNIFHESLLPFDEYDEEDAEKVPRRGEDGKLIKYTHVKTKDNYAFKVVDKEHVTQVKNQVTILKKLTDCQNIIRFYGLTYDTCTQTYYLITEWAEKENLREFISRRGQGGIPVKMRLGFAYDIAKGLNFLNAVKIVHRDIRSENVVITDRDVAKITNFKLSRTFNEATGNLTVDRECVGHSSPEMLRRGMSGEGGEKSKKYDTKCEVYSFGILLWEIAECRNPYLELEDFMEITTKVINGYREPFTPGTGIPERYQTLVNKAVSQNPGHRPIFSKTLTELRDILLNHEEQSTNQQLVSKRVPPTRKDSSLFNWGSFNYLTIDKAIEEHKKNTTDKSILYKCFDAYANMGNPKAKFHKAYFISKGWSDLNVPDQERYKITANLYKEAADHGDGYPEAQLRYALMVMQGKGVKKNMEEAIDYLVKAADNDHVVAMFNVATYYFSSGNDELGKIYMIRAADKKYTEAINYCKANNISYA